MDTLERKKRFGKNVARLRVEQNISVRKFAAMIGSNHSYLWEIETGRTNPGLEIMCRIADALDVPLKSLIDF